MLFFFYFKPIFFSNMMCTMELIEEAIIHAVGCYIGENSRFDACRAVTMSNRQEDTSQIIMVPPIGETKFKWFDICSGKSIDLVYKRMQVGQPIYAQSHLYNSLIHEIVTLHGPTVQVIRKFCEEALQHYDETINDKLVTYLFDANHEFWKRDTITNERSFESVIIEPTVKEKLMQDLLDFTEPETREWYKKHGIPFKRGYLLYGPPGTGKTSFITAIASKLKRRVYKVNLVAPKLSDDSLSIAVNQAKQNSIIVMEDLDSLFGKFRDKKENFCVTYSGLLNAIDGINNSEKGLIFIFTSNHPEQLDSALKRKGRIDLEIQLSFCSQHQCEQMFLKFFPHEKNHAKTFSQNVASKKRKVTPAQHQHHFIGMRKKSAEEAVTINSDIFEEQDFTHMWM